MTELLEEALIESKLRMKLSNSMGMARVPYATSLVTTGVRGPDTIHDIYRHRRLARFARAQLPRTGPKPCLSGGGVEGSAVSATTK